MNASDKTRFLIFIPSKFITLAWQRGVQPTPAGSWWHNAAAVRILAGESGRPYIDVPGMVVQGQRADFEDQGGV